MNIEDLTIRQAKELAAIFGAKPVAGPELSPLIGKYVIVRSRDSGVHSGVFAYHNGRNVRLTDSRRLWHWKAAKEHTLSAVSLFGLGDGKIASPVEVIEILDACEVIPASDEAEKSIRGWASHEPR